MAELAPKDLITSLRTPQYLFTDSYLNDPIKFPADPRFVPETVVRQLEAFIVLPRDLAQFAVVELNTTDQQFLTVSMYKTAYNRDDFNKVIKRKFTQLLTADLPII